jgi:tartrate-resistant acid phosphatase type 5
VPALPVISRSFCAIGLVLALAPSPVSAANGGCVLGDDPAATGDIAQISAVDSEIGMRCPCFDYDGSHSSKSHGAYVRCARGVVRTAVDGGALRRECARLTTGLYKRSACGFAVPPDPVSRRVPCIEERASTGAIRCAVKPVGRCVSSSATVRTACPAIESCVEAADDDGNYVIEGAPSGGDDGLCSRDTPVVRFVVVGDTGRGDSDQLAVAAGIEAKCAADGCDFVQLLGDNIYPSGVSSVADPQWQSKFETPYQGIVLPFYAVLGNHDYGGNGAGNELEKAGFEIDYASVSPKWKLPAAHYRRSWRHVDMFGLDTNLQVLGLDAEQRTQMAEWVSASSAQWRIAFGHHPYLSNGPHGNAGVYDGVVGSGAGVKSFLEDIICGRVDAYFSGHDHSLQWLTQTCAGSEVIVSGAGSQPSSLPGVNATHFQSLGPGFAYVVADGGTLTIELLAADGTLLFSRSLVKP